MSARVSLTLGQVSPLSNAIMMVFRVAKWISPMLWLSALFPVLRARSSLTQQEIQDAGFVKKRGSAIDAYLVFWLAASILLIVISSDPSLSKPGRIAIAAVIGVRLIEIVQVTVNVALFDRLSGRADEVVASHTRMIVLGGLNYVEMILGFGLVYATEYPKLYSHGDPVTTPITALYFSGITQLTTGYGDVVPTGWLRAIAIIQGLLALGFIVVIIGRVVASFPRLSDLSDPKRFD